jgi:hypothetical protein
MTFNNVGTSNLNHQNRFCPKTLCKIDGLHLLFDEDKKTGLLAVLWPFYGLSMPDLAFNYVGTSNLNHQNLFCAKTLCKIDALHLLFYEDKKTGLLAFLWPFYALTDLQ